MLKTLKIARIIAGLAAAGFIAYLAISGMKPDAELEDMLQKQSAVDKFRQLSDLVSSSREHESAFVKQAKAFALRINPPKPVIPKRQAILTPPKKSKPRPTPVKPTKTTKFSLVATDRYVENPEKSLALFNIVAEGPIWVRQGETIGHLTVHQINDGSVALYQDGQLNTEIFVPEPKKVKSLLKNTDAIETVTETPKAKEAVKIRYEPVANKAATRNNKYSTDRTLATKSRARTSQLGSKTPSQGIRNRRNQEEERRILDSSISGVKNIISQTMKSSKNSGSADELKEWAELLKLLQTDKKNIEDKTPKKDDKADKSKGTQKARQKNKAAEVKE